uniref:Uncharacterized protein n=1 Tax=Mycena chlorophos TaxID=658473 RepID=A0ABQ0LHX9_MYCCL|nr:predicted protein [Mycena chlorophos]
MGELSISKAAHVSEPTPASTSMMSVSFDSGVGDTAASLRAPLPRPSNTFPPGREIGTSPIAPMRLFGIGVTGDGQRTSTSVCTASGVGSAPGDNTVDAEAVQGLANEKPELTCGTA